LVPPRTEELRLRQKAITDTANVLRSDVERLPGGLFELAASHAESKEPGVSHQRAYVAPEESCVDYQHVMLTGIDDMTAGLSGPPPNQQTPQMHAQTSQYLSVNISIETNTTDAYVLSDQNAVIPVPDDIPVISLANINNFS